MSVVVTKYIENGILPTFFYMLLVVVGILLIGCVLEKMRLCLMKLLGADRFYRSMDEKFEHMLGKIVFDEKDIVNGN